MSLAVYDKSAYDQTYYNPFTEWHRERNRRIYDFLWLKDEFDRTEFTIYVYRQRRLIWDVRGYWHHQNYRPSTFIRNFIDYLIRELINNKIIEEARYGGKTIYRVIAKPTKLLIDEICLYTWLKDPV